MTAKFDRKNERHVRDLTSAAVQAALCEALFSSSQLTEKHDVRVKPGFETACWSYLPPHRIYVGTGIVARGKSTATEDELTEYVKSHVRHELAHALFTERNSRVVQQGLAAIKSPFQLWNLFEDARIEERYRVDERAFDWLLYEDLQFSDRPEGMLFAFIQAEGNRELVKSFFESADLSDQRSKALSGVAEALAAMVDESKQAELKGFLELLGMGPQPSEEMERERVLTLLDRVWEYYERIIAQPDTLGLFPILKEWMLEFGKPKSAPTRGDESGDGQSDLQMGYMLADDPEEREKFEAGTIPVTVPGGKGLATPDRDDKPVGQKGVVLGMHPSYLDLPRIEALASRFGKFFEVEARTVRTTSPQKRISARHFALGRPYFKVKQEVGKARRKLFMVLDCSGSMRGRAGGISHIEEGKVLVAALSRLARRGFVEGHIALSAGKPSRWELYKLPLADEVIAKISADYKAEGLEATIQGNLSLAREADYTLVYTDAQITDAAIDKDNLHKHGVFTWGLYAGQAPEYLSSMLDYFDKAILRDNAEQLVDAMLLQKK